MQVMTGLVFSIFLILNLCEYWIIVSRVLVTYLPITILAMFMPNNVRDMSTTTTIMPENVITNNVNGM